MLRSAILSMTMMTSMAHGATETAQMINHSVFNYAAVYTAAAGVLSVDETIVQASEARMYEAAAHLRPVVDYYQSGRLEQDFINRSRS